MTRNDLRGVREVEHGRARSSARSAAATWPGTPPRRRPPTRSEPDARQGRPLRPPPLSRRAGGVAPHPPPPLPPPGRRDPPSPQHPRRRHRHPRPRPWFRGAGRRPVPGLWPVTRRTALLRPLRSPAGGRRPGPCPRCGASRAIRLLVVASGVDNKDRAARRKRRVGRPRAVVNATGPQSGYQIPCGLELESSPDPRFVWGHGRLTVAPTLKLVAA